MADRIPVLYLAPWVGYGGSDKNTIDWFRWIDRERFAPYLITTQPSDNALIGEVTEYAEEVWVLPELMPGEQMPEFIFSFIESRRIEVVHLMNSRLGFDLLPDLTSLSAPPAVVVQLHVEEVDRSGYVRYVTTRYGNLVDRFSISNQHVADAVVGYGVPADKIEVIYTGVDADAEFSPDRHEPIEALPEDRLNVLFAARLTEQKNPFLMLDVAAALRDRGAPVQFHVVGDGDLADQVRERVAALGLGELVELHPPTPGLQRWYAAADVLLLTSRFEGVPCVVFEAMAMGMPIVSPALPAIRELLDQPDDLLIEDGESVEAYAEALAGLAADATAQARYGSALRERAKQRFSVQEMAAKHERIYSELAAARPKIQAPEPEALPEPIRFRDRAVLGQPLVSVLIPHFNQGRFLRECVDSVHAQSYPDLEIVVVDDASTEAGTAAVLEEVAALERVTVVRLEENGGPSRARNAGLESCSGGYILPLDSDNLLLPDAIEKLVAQLNSANEDIGFVYPNLDFFGNREEYHEAPPYNLYTLLHANFCDTCSLLDRAIFDAGLRYHSEIKLGHEDWEFALRLAAYGVRGEPAHSPTVRYRKWGFNRSDLVDHAYSDFRESFLEEVSPLGGHEARIKAEESPALSIVALGAQGGDAAAARELGDRLGRQSCIDLELVADVGPVETRSDGPPVRRFPSGDAEETLGRGLAIARGSFLALTGGSGAELLADPAFAEKVLRRFSTTTGEVDAIVLVDAGAADRLDFSPLLESGLAPGTPHTVIWRRSIERDLPFGLVGDPAAPVASVVRLLAGAALRLDWRHHSSGASGSAGNEGPPVSWRPFTAAAGLAGGGPPAPENASPPLLPGAGSFEVPRWGQTPTWAAPLSTIGIRYRERIGERRLIRPGRPPSYYDVEHFLGVLRSTGVQGTKKLIESGGSFRALGRDEWRDLPADAIEIGYLEEAPLPGLDAIALAVHRTSGQHILVSLPGDPLLHAVDVIEHLGFADPFPLRPHVLPQTERPVGLVGIFKSADLDARRHRYRLGGFPAGEQIGELGGLAESGLQGSIPFWIVDDYAITDRYRPPMRKPAVGSAIRWTAEPIAWGDLGPPAARLKVMLRRSAQSAVSRSRLGQGSPGPEGDPQGWLFEAARPGLMPLFASHHAVTGDQLLTRSVEDAVQMGYGDTQLLGFMSAAAPVTGEPGQRAVGMPWARRSGHVPQSA